TGGITYTFATGEVAFVQQVTQTNKAGTLAAAPNFGQPVWRGFISAMPSSFANLATVFNAGDIYFNSVPTTNGPFGWICTVGGTPGTWVAIGTNLNSGWIPSPPWLTGTAAPISGTYSTAAICWNSAPAAGQPIAWVCTAGGSPGTWKPL